MDSQSEDIEQLQTDIFLGNEWLTQMNNAAQHNGLTLQFCMALPRHALQTLKLNSVTQVNFLVQVVVVVYSTLLVM